MGSPWDCRVNGIPKLRDDNPGARPAVNPRGPGPATVRKFPTASSREDGDDGLALGEIGSRAGARRFADAHERWGGRRSGAHFSHGRVASATTASGARSIAFTAPTTGIPALSGGVTDGSPGVGPVPFSVSIVQPRTGTVRIAVKSLTVAFLTRATRRAAGERHVTGLRIGFNAPTLHFPRVSAGIAAPQSRRSAPTARTPRQTDDFVQSKSQIPNATGAMPKVRDAGATRSSSRKSRSIDRAALGTADAFPPSRPAVGRETRRSGSPHPAERRPTTDGMQEDWRAVWTDGSVGRRPWR
jgi:hypothetical protein